MDRIKIIVRLMWLLMIAALAVGGTIVRLHATFDGTDVEYVRGTVDMVLAAVFAIFDTVCVRKRS